MCTQIIDIVMHLIGWSGSFVIECMLSMYVQSSGLKPRTQNQKVPLSIPSFKHFSLSPGSSRDTV